MPILELYARDDDDDDDDDGGGGAGDDDDDAEIDMRVLACAFTRMLSGVIVFLRLAGHSGMLVVLLRCRASWRSPLPPLLHLLGVLAGMGP